MEKDVPLRRGGRDQSCRNPIAEPIHRAHRHAHGLGRSLVVGVTRIFQMDREKPPAGAGLVPDDTFS